MRTQRVSRRLEKNSVIDLARLDELLDVPVEAWDRAVARLVKTMRDKRVRVRVPDSRILAIGAATPNGVSWPRLFEAQIRSVPRMDRAEEFRMARRYEFLAARVRDALERAGYADPDRHVTSPLRDLPALPNLSERGALARRTALRDAVHEFQRLRNHYVEGALYLVLAPVRRYRNLGVDDADLMQEASASLFQAIDGFDWRRDVRFKTYAIFWIQQAILKALYDSSRTVRIPVWVQKAYRKIQKAREAARSESGIEPSSTAVAAQVGMPSERVDEILGVRRYAVSIDASVTADGSLSLGQTLADDRDLPIHEQIAEGDLRHGLANAMADIPERERDILARRFGLADRAPETLAEIASDMGITAERVRQLQNAALRRLKSPSRMRHLKAFSG